MKPLEELFQEALISELYMNDAEAWELVARNLYGSKLESDMLSLLGYVLDQKDAFNRPYWLCPQETWARAEELGYTENGATKALIPREGSYFQACRLTDLGKQEFYKLLDAEVKRSKRSNDLSSFSNAQTLELIKSLQLLVEWQEHLGKWYVAGTGGHEMNADLNRAVYECAAKVRQARKEIDPS